MFALTQILLKTRKTLLRCPRALVTLNNILHSNGLPDYFLGDNLLEPFHTAYRPSNLPKVGWRFPFTFYLEEVYLFHVPDFPKDYLINDENIDELRQKYELIIYLKPPRNKIPYLLDKPRERGLVSR